MSHNFRVTKMSGAGNDFIVLGPDEARHLGGELPAWARKACRRGLSIGADGVLVVEPGGEEKILVRFCNPDGKESFCGNGSRCAARYAYLHGFAGESMVLETMIGDVAAHVDGESVRLYLSLPEDRGPRWLERGDVRLEGRLLVAGVPHLVVFVEDVAEAPLALWGPWIRHDPQFAPDGTNVDLIGWRPDGSLAIRTWERGVEGETLACGSGAVAAATFVRGQGAASRTCVVPASGVPLFVAFEQRAGHEIVVLQGDARVIFEGTLGDDATSGFPAC